MQIMQILWNGVLKKLKEEKPRASELKPYDQESNYKRQISEPNDPLPKRQKPGAKPLPLHRGKKEEFSS